MTSALSRSLGPEYASAKDAVTFFDEDILPKVRPLEKRGVADIDVPGDSRKTRYLRTAIAISTASAAKLFDDEILDWCEWQWTHARTLGEPKVSALFDEYMATHAPA